MAAVDGQEGDSPQQVLKTLIAVVLSEDDDQLLFERVRTMFLDRATHHPPTARILNEGAEQVTHLLHGLIAQTLGDSESTPRIHPQSAAQLLWSMLDGLPATVALGQRSMTDARSLTCSLLHAAIVESAPVETPAPWWRSQSTAEHENPTATPTAHCSAVTAGRCARQRLRYRSNSSGP